ncbi:hypothetical protein TNCV_744241 [Trichonephila clavipes]|nr:hypothetical protein TNCV_744241 [Trichonephila clavipes]
MVIGFRARDGSISESELLSSLSKRRGKCDAPKAVDDRGERKLQRCVPANRRVTVEQLTAQMNHEATNSASLTTVQ